MPSGQHQMQWTTVKVQLELWCAVVRIKRPVISSCDSVGHDNGCLCRVMYGEYRKTRGWIISLYHDGSRQVVLSCKRAASNIHTAPCCCGRRACWPWRSARRPSDSSAARSQVGRMRRPERCKMAATRVQVQTGEGAARRGASRGTWYGTHCLDTVRLRGYKQTRGGWKVGMYSWATATV